MKQNITIEQLKELSDEAKERLRGWWKPVEGDKYIDDEELKQVVWCCEDDVEEGSLPLLSIGQMIEFLDEYGLFVIQKNSEWHGGGCTVTFSKLPRELTIEALGENISIKQGELCDALWEVCKEILESKSLV